MFFQKPPIFPSCFSVLQEAPLFLLTKASVFIDVICDFPNSAALIGQRIV